MRICFVGHQATKEGAGRFMLDQVDYLLDHGAVVFAILPENGPLCTELRNRGVEIAIVPNEWWKKPQGLKNPSDYKRALVASRTMAKWFRQWSIDVAYTETIVVGAGALAAALTGIPHVWHLHEFSYNPRAIDVALPRWFLARLMNATSNYVFFNSNVVAKEWAGLIPATKTRVVYNWTSPPDDSAPELDDEVAVALLEQETTFVAAVVATITPFKRQHDAVSAIGNLLHEGMDVALIIVGPAAHAKYYASLVELVAENGWKDRIRFVGYNEHPRRIMSRADVTLVCSDSEAFGRVTIESMSQGVPVIGADFGGTAEIIEDGVDGLLFPTGNVAVLTDRLRSLARDEVLRRSLAVNAKEKATRFCGADRTMAPVLAQLRSLVGERNPSWPHGGLIERGLLIFAFASWSIPHQSIRQAGGRIKRAIHRLW